ncbi:4-hydroxybenzoate octaprenyltransferase [Pedomonas sp. V897]|uniref:4-hydroxybenzoate octaprenyltransferase n=1 Tax=Pedomonas sp. V897 TaxID=3446482 RepID=UPI003EE13F56
MHQSSGSFSPDQPPVTPDAVRGSWVERMPSGWQPYLRLSRLDRPIGTWLLLLPCWWSASLASASTGQGFPDLTLLLLFALGAIAMRGAGCTFNDIVDRDIDARVARTRNRPLPGGHVTLAQAWVWLFMQCLVGLAVLLMLTPAAQVVALGSIALVAAYPFMKRITWWPQAWLGLTFNWGALVGWSAVTGDWPALPALLMYAAGVFWTLGYDTIYAFQDMEDDALVGVRSSARRLGSHGRAGVSVFYMLTSVLLLACLYAAGSGKVWLLLPAFVHMAWQVRTLRPENTPLCLHLFRSNRDCGLLVWGACLFAM